MHGANRSMKATSSWMCRWCAIFRSFKSFSVNGAGAINDYSTSGQAETWRLGRNGSRSMICASGDPFAGHPGSYALRLFQSQTGNISGLVDYFTQTGGSVVNVSGGNPNLVPEVARNTTAGCPTSRVGCLISTLPSTTTMSSSTTRSPVSAAPLRKPSKFASRRRHRPLQPGGTAVSDHQYESANYPTLNYNVKQNVALTYAEGVDIAIGYQSDLARGIPVDRRYRPALPVVA